MKKIVLMLALVSVSGVHGIDFSEFEQDQADIGAANALLGLSASNVNEIAQQKHVEPETAAWAILWMNEHPSTPMPSTPLDYTGEQIEQAATKYKSYRKNMTPAQLAELNARNAEYNRRWRAKMSPEQRAKYSAQQVVYSERWLAKMTPEQRAAYKAWRVEYNRQRWANRTPAEREAYKERQVEYQNTHKTEHKQRQAKYRHNQQEAFYTHLREQKLYDESNKYKVNISELLERLHQGDLNNDIDATMLTSALSGYKLAQFTGESPVSAARVRTLAQYYKNHLEKVNAANAQKRAGGAVSKRPKKLSPQQVNEALGVVQNQ